MSDSEKKSPDLRAKGIVHLMVRLRAGLDRLAFDFQETFEALELLDRGEPGRCLRISVVRDGFRYVLLRSACEGGEPLSERERQIADLAARGGQNKDIGLALGLSEHTVAAHLRKIYKKLSVGSRVELAQKFLGLTLAKD